MLEQVSHSEKLCKTAHEHASYRTLNGRFKIRPVPGDRHSFHFSDLRKVIRARKMLAGAIIPKGQ